MPTTTNQIDAASDDTDDAVDAEATDSQLAADTIWARIVGRMEDRLLVVEQGAHLLFDGSPTAEDLEPARDAARELARMFGELEASRIALVAREMETALHSEEAGPVRAVRIATASEDIRSLMQSAVAQQRATTRDRAAIVALGSPSEGFDRMAWVLASRGHTVVPFDDATDWTAGSVAAVVAWAAAEDASTTDLALRIASESWSAPMLTLHDDVDVGALRRLAARSTTLMPTTASAETICAELERYEVMRRTEPAVVIHGRVTKPILTRLRRHGFRVVRAPDIDAVVTGLQDAPGVALFGYSVSTADVLAATRLLRALPNTRRTMVMRLVQADERPSDTLGDLDVVATTDIHDRLVWRARATALAIAADSHSGRVETDEALAWSAARVLVDRAIVAAARSDSALVMATVDLDPAAEPERLEAVRGELARAFRPGDVVGYRSDESMVITLPGVSRRVATTRLRQILDRLDVTDITRGAAVAVFPSDGTSSDELLDAADASRRFATAHDGPLVTTTTWRPAGEQVADVLVVEDDPVLAGMYAATIRAHGYSAEIITNGEAARERMTDPDNPLAPPLLLLDLDVAGLDGMRLLRELRRAGALAQTNVLLMTTRSTESELRAAFAVGVADVIRKPFSSTLLVHRVERLLADR